MSFYFTESAFKYEFRGRRDSPHVENPESHHVDNPDSHHVESKDSHHVENPDSHHVENRVADPVHFGPDPANQNFKFRI